MPTCSGPLVRLDPRASYIRTARRVHTLFIDVNELTDSHGKRAEILGDVYAARLFGLVGRRLDLDRWRPSSTKS